jgi:amino acid transporter
MVLSTTPALNVDQEMQPIMLAQTTNLRPHCLNFWTVLAQNIALISPTMTAALIVPLMFGTSGQSSWLAYAFGTVMLLFVAANLIQFAKRSSHTGSMFLYSMAGLGPTAGGLSGWCLIWAYMFIGTAGVTGFTVFSTQLLTMAHITVPPVALFAVCAAICWYCAYKDVRLSAILMLVLEAVSVALITILAFIVLGHHGFAIDPDQISLKGNSLSTLGLGVVVAVFSLVGFEAATAFGEEAKDPLKTIPRAIIVALVLTGLFFVFITYTEVLGLRGVKPPLDQQTAPLSTLATLVHLDVLQIPIDLGAMLSFFSLALSCMNAGSRVVFQMGRHGFFHEAAGRAHHVNETPHYAITIYAILLFLIPTCIMSYKGVAVTDAFNDAGTFGAFGFLGAYTFVSVAAPMYLKKLGQLRPLDIVWSVAALVCLLVPAVGSVYPVPSPPVNLFVYVFALYFIVGAAYFVARGMAGNAPITVPENVLEERVGVAPRAVGAPSAA